MSDGMTFIERYPDDTAESLLARLADMTEGLPFEETDDNADLVARAIRLAHQHAGAVDALDSADLLADAIFEGVTQRTLESIAGQYRVARQHVGGQS